MPMKAVYRNRTSSPRRPAHGEPGTLLEQFTAIGLYLEAQADLRRTGYRARRLWTVCHCLATDRPIPSEADVS